MGFTAGARLVFAVVAVAVAVAGKPDPAGVPAPPGTRVASRQARITVSAPSGDVATAVTSNAELGLDLIRALVAAAPQDNLVISPYSISAALAMTYGGSAGTTHAAFDAVLHQRLAPAAYHRAMNDLDRQLASRGQRAHGTGGQPFRLDATNQLFAEVKAQFLPSYLDLLAQEYGAAAQLLDFAAAPDPSRVSINRWVEQKTSGFIKDLLPDGTVSRDTRGVLVNAMYFDAAWATKFDPSHTSAGLFHGLDGASGNVQMMRYRSLSAVSATVDGVEVVSLPYDGRELSLTILMPPSGAFTAWERALTVADIAGYAAARRQEQLTLSIPKFTVRTSSLLTHTLKDLGLAIAFSDAADFSRMSAPGSLRISDVVHQALIVVDEAGTVAAAATGVTMGRTSVARMRTVVIDRPFLYLVRDEATGAILFLGRYVRPDA